MSGARKVPGFGRIAGIDAGFLNVRVAFQYRRADRAGVGSPSTGSHTANGVPVGQLVGIARPNVIGGERAAGVGKRIAHSLILTCDGGSLSGPRRPLTWVLVGCGFRAIFK